MEDIDYSKINKIDCILWINMDRSLERRNLMENQLKNINIKNIRISAYDAEIYDKPLPKSGPRVKKLQVKNKKPICCTMSHLKAIHTASKLEGEYFLILEDDIVFHNFKYSNSLCKIIEEAPEFDILIIGKTFLQELPDLYTKHKNEIYGTFSYIVSRKGINKIKEFFEYSEVDDTFICKKKYITFADHYLYSLCDTFVYKYNLINETSYDSTLNSNINFHKKSTEFNNNILLRDFNKFKEL